MKLSCNASMLFENFLFFLFLYLVVIRLVSSLKTHSDSIHGQVAKEKENITHSFTDLSEATLSSVS